MNQNPVRIAVASTNPVKIEAARLGFERAFPHWVLQVQGVSVRLDTPDQPIGDEVTYQGAVRRMQALKEVAAEYSFFVGIEGGVERRPHGYDSFAWIVLGDARRQAASRTGTFYLPPAVCRLLDEGLELGDADDQVFGRTQSKQQGGAIGLLTHNQITRTHLLAESVFLALIPFQNPALFQ